MAPRVLQYVAIKEEGTQANLDSIDGTIPMKSTLRGKRTLLHSAKDEARISSHKTDSNIALLSTM